LTAETIFFLVCQQLRMTDYYHIDGRFTRRCHGSG